MGAHVAFVEQGCEFSVVSADGCVGRRELFEISFGVAPAAGPSAEQLSDIVDVGLIQCSAEALLRCRMARGPDPERVVRGPVR